MTNNIKLVNLDEFDIYECECGNTSYEDGFSPCDNDGNVVEPTKDSDWNGLYVCSRCRNMYRIED